MPRKNTKATPSDTPSTLIFPKAKPQAHSSDKTTTACTAECVMNMSLSHCICSISLYLISTYSLTV